MIKVNKKINLEQLDKELSANGLVALMDDNDQVIAVGLASNSTITKDELADGIKVHNAVFTEPTIADKLASVGLSLDELKAAILGGN